MRRRWRPRADPQLVDIGLAAAVAVVSVIGLSATNVALGAGSPLRWVLGVALALPLLARRRQPVAALLLVAGVAVAHTIVLREMPAFGAFLALLIGAFSVGAHADVRIGLAAMAVCLLAVVLVGVLVEPLSVEGVVIPFVYLGAAWGTGRLVASRSARADALASMAERLVHEQAERERAVLAEERARISRELHDVVAHAVTTMVLQAGAAQAELGRDVTRTRTRLATIESSGREALDELRRVLTVMRDPDASGVEEPMPGIGELPALAERISASGVAVELAIDTARELPAGLGLSVYRIVQEALTNVLRHASATRARVRIGESNGAVTIEVTDDGRGRAGGGAVEGSGRGLIGMRERAALFGGTLEAGPDRRGGYGVRARLPVRETHP